MIHMFPAVRYRDFRPIRLVLTTTCPVVVDTGPRSEIVCPTSHRERHSYALLPSGLNLTVSNRRWLWYDKSSIAVEDGSAVAASYSIGPSRD